MNIESILLENFRCYLHQVFQFGAKTSIYGDNGTGKSTIAEAVVWCLFGTDILGKTKQDENLMRIGATSMSVAVTMVNKNGERNIYARTRVSKKASVLTVNGARPKAGEMEGRFGTVSEFLSVFFPGYFSSLEPKEAKTILAKCVPGVPKQDVLRKMKSDSAKLLSNDQFAMGIDSIDIASSKVRAEIAELEKSILRYVGQLDAYQSALDKGQPAPLQSQVSLHDLEELKNLTKEHGKLSDMYRIRRASIPTEDTYCHTCGQALRLETANQIHQQRLAEIVEEGKRVKSEVKRLQSVTRTPPVDSNPHTFIQQIEQKMKDERQIQIEHETRIKMFRQAQADMRETQTYVDAEKKNLAVQQRKLKTLQEFRFEYLRLQHDKMNALFLHVRIRLVDWNVETGEVRESFRIEWKGRPYRLLSFSEKIRCDLEIGRVLAQARGESIPVYVDNAESVQNLFAEKFSGQVIAAFVSTGNITVQTDTTHVEVKSQVA